jgi:hypothetical protein
MSFDTLADLKTQVNTWLARDDLNGNIEDFIRLFECTAARRLRIRMNETTATLTPSSGSVALPSDFLMWRRVTWMGSPRRDLTYMPPAALEGAYPGAETGIPVSFTIEGTNLRVRMVDDSPLEMGYFAKSDSLIDGLNSLFTNWPDAYLFGVLAEAYLFNKDPDNAAIWIQRRDGVFDELVALQFRENGAMQMRVVGPTP